LPALEFDFESDFGTEQVRIGGSLWLKSLTKAFLLTNGHESTHYTCSTLIFVGGDCQLRPIERMA